LSIKNAALGIEVAKADYLPSLSMNVGLNTFYNHNQGKKDDFINPITGDLVSNGFFTQLDNNFGQSVSLSLRIPIFNGFRTNTNIKKAKINHLLSQNNLTSQKLKLREAIERAFTDAKSSLKSYEAATKSLAAQNESFRFAKEKFEAGQSNLTWDNYLFILIWNPLRNVWYFYDTFKSKDWVNFSYSTLDSPFGWDYSQKIANKYWIESDEYRRRVLWEFPREDILDDKWFVQLILEKDINYVYQDETMYWWELVMWVDCAWEWKDKTTWVIRNHTKAIIVWYEAISSPKSIANKTLTIMREYWVKWDNVIIDNFWAWANVWMELATMWVRPKPIYVWDSKRQEYKWQKCKNLRAKLFWQLREWIKQWWVLAYRDYWKELLNIRYKRTIKDEVQIMSKEDMKKMWYSSPDFADSLSMTFYIDLTVSNTSLWETDYSELL